MSCSRLASFTRRVFLQTKRSSRLVTDRKSFLMSTQRYTTSSSLDNTVTGQQLAQDDNTSLVELLGRDTLSVLNNLKCIGCGTTLQYSQLNTQGYVPGKKLQQLIQQIKTCSDKEHVQPPICQRCFYLKHYNTALDTTLLPDEYKVHLSYLKDQRALVLCIVDVTDIPSSIFPELNAILGTQCTVYIVANKIDLLPDMNRKSLNRLKDYILKEFAKSLVDKEDGGAKPQKRCGHPDQSGTHNGQDTEVTQVLFVSAKTNRGVDDLTEKIVEDWGNRGDVYLVGCTNVGKSSLFNHLLHSLCGAEPGQLKTISNVSAPSPTISHWPGTTLGRISFPIMSVGKRRRLMSRAVRQEKELEDMIFEKNEIPSYEHQGYDTVKDPSSTEDSSSPSSDESDDLVEVLNEIGLKGKTSSSRKKKKELQIPKNRFWLHDTPGAVNDLQSVNHLTTKELNLVLPKKHLSPRTFILKPGQSMFVGGLGRLDFIEGGVSIYFTVFASSYLPVHVTQISKADDVYGKNLGGRLLKIPAGDGGRLKNFPSLESSDFSVECMGWKQSTCDIILSSVGWVAVTGGKGERVILKGYTPHGKGLFMRIPSLFPNAVNERGKRLLKGNRTAFVGSKKKPPKTK